MQALKIKDWDKVFENSESRKLKKLSWVLLPNKWDGLSFSRLKKHKNFVCVFAGWILMLEIASKMPRRGLLVTTDGVALTPDDMSDMTGCNADIFSKAVEVLTDERIGWLEYVNADGRVSNTGIPPDYNNLQTANGEDTISNAELASKTPKSPDASGKSPDMPGFSPVRIEQNRIEQKGTEISGDSASAPKFHNPISHPPTIQDVKRVAEGYGVAFTESEAQEFLDWHISRGWEINKTLIRDWRPRVRRWKEAGRDMKKAPEKPERRRMSL